VSVIERFSPARLWRVVGILAAACALAAGGCDWFDSPVEVNQPPDTWIVTCPAGGVVTAGEDVPLGWEGTDPDGSAVPGVAGSVDHFEWALDDTLLGETTATSITLEAVEAGEHTFTVAAVDVKGDADPTPAVCGFSATEGGSLVPRVVLAEMLTTQYCSNCPKAEQALDELIDDYGADEFTVITYHYEDEQYIDPVATDESVARIEWYYANHQGPDPDSNEDDVGHYATVYPLVIFDGGRFVVGASTVESAKTNYQVEIENRRAVMSPVSIDLSGDITGGGGDVTATVNVHDSLLGGPYVLRIVVIENGIVIGSNHFDFVARAFLDEENLTVSQAGDSTQVERAFTVDPGWNIDNMDVIAFVQDDSSTEVIQSARLSAQ
jgi:hypothetical protein